MPTLLASQIAAGEVVERPASVVKELVENAIDAGATRVTVELELGGIELVRVSDDGVGIPSDELRLALLPHATSKVSIASDLDRISTMGFRGEALASITSVARVSIRSRPASQEAAAEICAEGDEVQPVKPASGPVGSVVTVRNLFFNTPARRKFLRTPPSEQGRCVDVVRQIALAHPAVGFVVRCDTRTVIDVPHGQGPRDRTLAILGRELQTQLLEVNADALETGGALVVWGLIGTPDIARATAAALYLYINGRSVRDRTMQHAVREAYRGLIEPGRYPTAVVMVEMDPGAVDVNVHPAKAEVRFRDSSAVHQSILRACRRALQKADLTPAVRLDVGLLGTNGSGGGFGGGGSFGTHAFERGEILPSRPGRVIDARMLAEQLRVRPVGMPEPMVAPEDERLGLSESPAEAGGPMGPMSEANPPAPAGGAGELLDASPTSPALQIHNSFLVTQDSHGVVIIDQHALHERVMFEKLLARVGAGELESQRMLVPATLKVSPKQLDALEALQPLLKRIGTEVQPLGPEDVAIQSFASFLFERGVEPGPFIAELLDRAVAEGFPDDQEQALRDVLDMMSCKAAVKAGDHLSDIELAELLNLRDQVERSSNCPHGRPTSIRLSIRELEKRFGRG